MSMVTSSGCPFCGAQGEFTEDVLEDKACAQVVIKCEVCREILEVTETRLPKRSVSIMEEAARPLKQGEKQEMGPIVAEHVMEELRGTQRTISYARSRLDVLRREVAEVAETLEQLRKREEELLKQRARLEGLYEKASKSRGDVRKAEEEAKIAALEKVRKAVSIQLQRDVSMEDAMAFILEGKGVEERVRTDDK